MTVITLQETQRALFYAPFYAALSLGAYEREGVEVNFVSASSPDMAVQGLYSGTADVTWGGPMRVLVGMDRDPGCDLVCFCEVVARDPFVLVGRTPRPAFRLEDLVGRRLGLVTEVPTPWMCLQEDLRRAGIDPACLDAVRAGTMAENADGLWRGELEVVQLLDPLATELERERVGFVWYEAATRGPTALTGLYTRRGMLKERRVAFVAMVRALTGILEWIGQADPAEVARAVSPFFEAVPVDVAAAGIARYQRLGIWATTPVMSREGFDRLAGSLVSGGLVSATAPYEAVVDNSLALEAASRSAGPPGPTLSRPQGRRAASIMTTE